MAARQIEAEQRWTLTPDQYDAVTGQLVGLGFRPKVESVERPYIEDIYYDRVTSRGYKFRIHDALVRARLERKKIEELEDMDLIFSAQILTPIKATFKRRVKHGGDPDVSFYEHDLEFQSEEEFHEKERKLLNKKSKIIPVLAFLRYRLSYQGNVAYKNREWMATTEGDTMLRYKMQEHEGLAVKDKEGQKRFPRMFSIEVVPLDPNDFETAQGARDKLARTLGLDDIVADTRTVMDIILEDARKKGIIP